MAAPFANRPSDGPTAVDHQRALLEDARRELRRARSPSPTRRQGWRRPGGIGMNIPPPRCKKPGE